MTAPARRIRRGTAAVLTLAAALLCLALAGCGMQAQEQAASVQIDGLTYVETVPLSYADQFTIDRYEGGYALITISNGDRFLVVPPGQEAPPSLEKDIVTIRQGVENLYVAASAAMDFFAALDSLDAVRLCGLRAEDWYVDEARTAMEQGELLYAGKYSGPDYELLLAQGCTLSIQNTMIEHAPEVREKLQDLGIAVLEDYSSYEAHPLGRCEWIKVYGALLGKSEEAEALFAAQKKYLDAVAEMEETGKTVAFFYINSAGQAVCRSSSDYVSKMIALAGGESVFRSLENDGSARSTVTMEMEKFSEEARDADVVIYNSTLGGDVQTLEELLGKNALLADFKAVRSGDVWCTGHNFYQEPMRRGEMISEMHTILTEPESGDLSFLHRLRES